MKLFRNGANEINRILFYLSIVQMVLLFPSSARLNGSNDLMTRSVASVVVEGRMIPSFIQEEQEVGLGFVVVASCCRSFNPGE